jgi:hypothetical protein
MTLEKKFGDTVAFGCASGRGKKGFEELAENITHSGLPLKRAK